MKSHEALKIVRKFLNNRGWLPIGTATRNYFISSKRFYEETLIKVFNKFTNIDY